MTEKRFVRICDVHYKPVNNNQTGESYTIDELIKLLNELDDENEQLKEEKQAIKKVLDELEKEYNNAANLDETSRKVLMVIDRVRECWND